MKAGNVKWVRLGDYISQRRENNFLHSNMALTLLKE